MSKKRGSMSKMIGSISQRLKGTAAKVDPSTAKDFGMTALMKKRAERSDGAATPSSPEKDGYELSADESALLEDMRREAGAGGQDDAESEAAKKRRKQSPSYVMGEFLNDAPAATRVTPSTVFTLGMLRQFTLLCAQSPVPAKDYLTYLSRLTDNVRSAEVDDRYRELLHVEREYMFLLMCKWSGVNPERKLKEGCLAVKCPACPQPGVNMHPNWKKTRKDESFIHSLHLSVDGNFQQNSKHKRKDDNDFPLTEGAAYHAHEGAFTKYQATLSAEAAEKSTCQDFVAMGFRRHWGNVSGVVSVVCARHMFVTPCGTVDLQKGERYANVDWALLSAMRPWMSLLCIVFMYDINCQYQINFRTRMVALIASFIAICAAVGVPDAEGMTFTILSLPFILAAIGKFHLPCHILA
ncbi:hypothetical protein EUX98_g8857 [Antrodiella citrinella]|uniref:CxC2-like cysteine cluster KDZ transposase-associated domain-containing protein n=1 Tax=Antrodiella citrinella TaxID=2447956 RepID=A0A4S4M383_9APHY|nr:hypothetical protein EUX98_g8857 [Antrodiella citrinella]